MLKRPCSRRSPSPDPPTSSTAPPPEQKRHKKQPAPFHQALKAAKGKALAKPTASGGDTETQRMLASLRQKTNAETVSLASQETSKGLRRSSAAAAARSSSKAPSGSGSGASSSKAALSKRSVSTSLGPSSSKASTDSKEVILIGSVLLLPCGVELVRPIHLVFQFCVLIDFIQANEEHVGGSSDVQLSISSRPRYMFLKNRPPKLDNMYINALESVGLFFKPDAASPISISLSDSHEDFVAQLCMLLPEPFKHINPKFRMPFSDDVFKSPFLLVYKNRSSLTVASTGPLPTSMDIQNHCFHRTSKTSAAERMLIIGKCSSYV